MCFNQSTGVQHLQKIESCSIYFSPLDGQPHVVELELLSSYKLRVNIDGDPLYPRDTHETNCNLKKDAQHAQKLFFSLQPTPTAGMTFVKLTL